MLKINHYLGHENKVNENNALSDCGALRSMWGKSSERSIMTLKTRTVHTQNSPIDCDGV